MARLDAFWDRLADRYAAQPVADATAYETKLAETRRHFRPDMDLLEFGCGTGSTAIIHAPHVRSIRAIDFSARMIDIARTKAEAAGVTNVSFEQGDITSMDLPTNHFDMVLGLSILHLLKDTSSVLARVHNLVKPGGFFVSSTTCIGDTMGFLAPIAPILRSIGLLPQLTFMTQKQLRDAITDAGFVIEHDWQPNPKAAVFIIARKPL